MSFIDQLFNIPRIRLIVFSRLFFRGYATLPNFFRYMIFIVFNFRVIAFIEVTIDERDLSVVPSAKMYPSPISTRRIV
jgi:hypothetical protein